MTKTSKTLISDMNKGWISISNKTIRSQNNELETYKYSFSSTIPGKALAFVTQSKKHGPPIHSISQPQALNYKQNVKTSESFEGKSITTIFCAEGGASSKKKLQIHKLDLSTTYLYQLNKPTPTMIVKSPAPFNQVNSSWK